jgi:hypothetical protein
MKSYISICFFLIAAVAATAVIAQTKAGKKIDTPAVQLTSDADNILKIVTQTQNDVKALQIAVTNLAVNQKDQATQMSTLLKDVARRLYATCVLTQRQMDMVVPGGWSENTLCTYRGLTAGSEAVTRDIFGQNPTNIDTAFGGP